MQAVGRSDQAEGESGCTVSKAAARQGPEAAEAAGAPPSLQGRRHGGPHARPGGAPGRDVAQEQLWPQLSRQGDKVCAQLQESSLEISNLEII